MKDNRELPTSWVVPWPVEFAEHYRSKGLWLGQTIGDWFIERAVKFSERVAIVDGERRVSYRELLQRSLKLAAALKELGLLPLDRVVVQLPNSAEALEVFLGLELLGVIPVLAQPLHRQLDLQAFCERARATALISFSHEPRAQFFAMLGQLRQRCPNLQHLIIHDSYSDTPRGCLQLAKLFGGPSGPSAKDLFAEPWVTNAHSSNVALLQLSGGSTGVPKLIPRAHDDYLYSVRVSAELCGLDTGTRYLAVLPMFHNFTLSSPGLLGTLDKGGAVVVCSAPTPDRIYRLISEEQVSITAIVPALVRSLMDAKTRCFGARPLESMILQVGGAKLDETLARQLRTTLGCKLQQVFGMAEGLVNYTRLNAGEATVLRTQGSPLSSFDELRIVDPGNPLGPALQHGAIGELQTRGPYTIRGYWDDREHDSKHFTPDGYYRTGDLVRRTLTGELIVEGRLGERILRAGEKVSPSEIEQHILKHPSVREVAVVGAPDRYLGERVHACVVLATPFKLSLPELRAYLRELGLAEFKLPDVLHLVQELPLTAVGKTDKVSLRKAFADLREA